jgi:hypothetical protein
MIGDKMFFNKIKIAFKRVKNDFLALKGSVNEWVLYLDSSNRDLKMRVVQLERRLAELEKQKLKEIIELC